MRLLRYLAALLCVLTMQASAQWTWLSPLPEGNEYFDATFANAQKGWITGGNGTVMATTDGGATWRVQATPLRTTPFIGLSVVFTDDLTGLIATNNGTLLGTSDGGMLWDIRPSSGLTIQRLKMDAAKTIWGYGGNGTIAKTTDNGRTWTRLNTGTTTVIFDLAFPAPLTITAACGGGLILTSTDGGSSWNSQTRPVTSDIVSIAFTDTQHAFALQQSKFLLRSTDGGQTWNDTTIFVNQLRQIRFANASSGWMLSNSQGTVHHTTDGGHTWTQVTVDPTFRYSFQSVLVRNAQEAILMGEGGGIFVTTDGGATWAQRGTGATRAHLRSVTALNDSTAWVFGTKTAVFSTDRGATWTANRAPSVPALNCGYALSASRLVAGGAQGEVLLSTDAGATWNTMTTLASAGQIEQIVFLDANNGWLAGNHGTVARTTDGGTSWTAVTTGATDDYHGIHALSASNVWLAGTGGVLLHTTNAGTNWQSATSGTSSTLQTVYFTSATEGWAGGQLVLLHTTDAGVTWTLSQMPGLDVVYRISFSDAKHGFFVLSRTVARTKDGGATFYRSDYPSTGLHDIAALPSGNLWLVGDFGAILRYAPCPAVMLDPSYLDFGDVSTNRSKNLKLKVVNTGELDMTLTNAAVLGTGFSIASATPQVIRPDSSAIVTIRFAPPDTLHYLGVASVQTDAKLGTPSIEVRGHGIPPGTPAFTHSPAIVDFGKIKLGTFKPLEVQLRNHSQLTIMVNDEIISGGDSLMFQLARPSMYFWPVNAVDSVRTLFAPQKPGTFTSNLVISSSDPVEPEYSIPLRGEAINSKATPSDTVMRFGYVYLDSVKTMYLVITNTGTADLLTANYDLQGGNNTEFSVVPPASTPTAPTGVIVVPVSFKPKTFGPKSTNLYFETNDVMKPTTTIPLLGNATTLTVGQVPSADGITLAPSYPNPVVAGLTASNTVDLARDAHISLVMYDVLGRPVLTIARGRYGAGAWVFPFSTSGLVPGAYTVELRAVMSDGPGVVRRSRIVITR